MDTDKFANTVKIFLKMQEKYKKSFWCNFPFDQSELFENIPSSNGKLAQIELGRAFLFKLYNKEEDVEKLDGSFLIKTSKNTKPTAYFPIAEIIKEEREKEMEMNENNSQNLRRKVSECQLIAVYPPMFRSFCMFGDFCFDSPE